MMTERKHLLWDVVGRNTQRASLRVISVAGKVISNENAGNGQLRRRRMSSQLAAVKSNLQAQLKCQRQKVAQRTMVLSDDGDNSCALNSVQRKVDSGLWGYLSHVQ